MSEKNLEQVIEDLGRGYEAFKETNDKLQSETREHGQALGETKEKLENIEKHLDELRDTKSRLEKMELSVNRPRNPGQDSEFSPEAREHMEAFTNWVRDFSDPEAQARLRAASRKMAVDTTGNATGGYAVPEVISAEIEKKLIDVSPFRSRVQVVTAGTPEFKKLVNVGGKGYGWVGETDARSESDTSNLAEVAPTFGTIYAYPFATEESLQDVFFNVQSWLTDEALEAFALGEGEAIVSGNGTKKPTGFLNPTPEAVGDDETSPERTFGSLEYVPTGISDGFGSISTTSPEHYPGDVLIDLLYKLKAGYRAGAEWSMNKNSLATIRKFKDVDGNYIWQPGLASGQPDRLLGYPVFEAEAMPDIGANAFPVAFGNFRRAYLLVDLAGMRMSIDDNITAPGYVKFYMRRRMGGILQNDDALKVIKCATS